MPSFKSLGLSDEILTALAEMGFENPTEIQEKAIPTLLKENADFIGLAQTGTGKTAAFGLPLLDRIDPGSPATQVLILAPTRELVQQIAGQLEIFAANLEQIKVLAVYGGASIQPQMKALRKGVQVLVATPGRLIDLIGRGAVLLEEMEILILDEADEMMNMGFREELEQIMAVTPQDKLTWLFSATMPDDIRRMVSRFMHDPVTVEIDRENEVNADIVHQYAVIRHKHKFEALKRFLDMEDDFHGLLFCRTRVETQSIAERLRAERYPADALHGDMTQHQRDKVMEKFRKKELKILVGTDVAARGIDVDDLTHVLHYTLPDDNSYYTHRSGRTARAGKTGISLALLTANELSKLDQLEKDLGIEFDRVFAPSREFVTEKRVERWCKDLVEMEPRRKMDPELMAKVMALTASLSREDLLEKIVYTNLSKQIIAPQQDVNESKFIREELAKQERKGGKGRGKKFSDGKKGGKFRGKGGGFKGKGGPKRDFKKGGKKRGR